jgi:hypothetical protein
VQAAPNPIAVTLARIWVACFSLFMLGVSLFNALSPDPAAEYFEPEPWRPLIFAGGVGLALALGAVAFGVSKPTVRILLALPIVSALAYWIYALVYQASINQLNWKFTLITGAVYGIPLLLSLILLAIPYQRTGVRAEGGGLPPNKSLERTRER